nr:ATP-binding protein [Hymenobacter sp. BT188]
MHIRVQDNGTGMSQAVREKIFQPFFTTKPPGEGTGLGLSLSYDIIAQGHGGGLAVESQEGHGSEFTVSLDCVDTKLKERSCRGARRLSWAIAAPLSVILTQEGSSHYRTTSMVMNCPTVRRSFLRQDDREWGERYI